MEVEDGVILARVEVFLPPIPLEGREGLRTGTRPNHWFPGCAHSLPGQLDLEDRVWLHPGESCVARCRFVVTPEDAHFVSPGQVWHISEGGHVRGFGRVLALLGA